MTDFNLLIIVPRNKNSMKFEEKTPLMNWSINTLQKISVCIEKKNVLLEVHLTLKTCLNLLSKSLRG